MYVIYRLGHIADAKNEESLDYGTAKPKVHEIMHGKQH